MLMLILVLIATLLAIASGVWVAVVLVRTLVQPPARSAQQAERDPSAR